MNLNNIIPDIQNVYGYIDVYYDFRCISRVLE